MIGNAEGLGSTIGLLGAHLISPIQEELFVAGKAFSYEDYLLFGSSEVKNIIFDSSGFTGVNLTINPILFGAVSGPILIDFYTNTTFNEDGTILVASNRREGMPAPKSILRLNPTGLTLGDRFSGDMVTASGVGVGNANPGANLAGLPFEINPSKGHALAINNTDGAGVYVQIKMTWFEV